jgi:hypothetical protein
LNIRIKRERNCKKFTYNYNAHITFLTFLPNPGGEDDSSDVLRCDDDADGIIKGGDDGRPDSDILRMIFT